MKWNRDVSILSAFLLLLLARGGMGAEPLGTAFTYQGQLRDSGGFAGGAYNMQFRLCPSDACEAADALDAFPDTGTVPVYIENGLFTQKLEFDSGLFDGDARWLEIVINGETLCPRQEVTAAPYALYALEGPADSLWESDGSDIYYFGGNVGIGTADPGCKLHVSGGLSGGAAWNGTYDFVFENDSSSVLNLVAPTDSESAISFSDTTRSRGAIRYDHATDAMNFRTAGADGRIYIDSDGYVGFGTTAPESRLHVFGHGTTSTWSFDNIAGTLQVSTPTGDPGLSSYANNGHRRDIRFGEEGISILTSPSETWPVATNGITIDEGGHVGIGTTGPSHNLHVIGSGLTRIQVESSDHQAGIAFKSDSSGEVAVYTPNDSNDLYFYAGSVNRMRINSTGEVVVGTETIAPNGLLTVPGLITSTSGGFKFPDGTVQATAATGSGGGVGGSGDAGYVPKFTNGTTIANSAIYDDEGDIGIGTISPGGKLHVSGGPSGGSAWNGTYDFVFENDSSAVLNLVAPEDRESAISFSDTARSRGAIRYDHATDAMNFRTAGVDGRIYIDSEGDVGIGLTDPDARLHVVGPATGNMTGAGYFQTPDGQFQAWLGYTDGDDQRQAGYFNAPGRSSATLANNYYGVSAAGISGGGVFMDKGQSGYAQVAYGDQGIHATGDGYGGHFLGTGTTGTGVYAEGTAGGYAATLRGNVRILSLDGGDPIIELGEGLDYAEGFDVSDAAVLEPGTVLVIDPDSPGELTVSRRAYDTKVAGIVAGANGLGSGVRLGAGGFDHDVALAGRVYCNVEAISGAVQPGDLLTTSPTPGYAMKVKNHARAQGAILGKAMQGLASGEKGKILVLVTLQ